MEGIVLVSTHAIGVSVGILLCSKFFGYIIHPVKALMTALVSSVVYLIPTVGGVVSFAVLILLIGYWSSGDWPDAFYTAFVSRGLVFALAVIWTSRFGG